MCTCEASDYPGLDHHFPAQASLPPLQHSAARHPSELHSDTSQPKIVQSLANNDRRTHHHHPKCPTPCSERRSPKRHATRRGECGKDCCEVSTTLRTQLQPALPAALGTVWGTGKHVEQYRTCTMRTFRLFSTCRCARWPVPGRSVTSATSVDQTVGSRQRTTLVTTPRWACQESIVRRVVAVVNTQRSKVWE